MTLEEMIRTAAAKGITHLTLYPVQSADNKTTYWHARATPSTGHQYVHEICTDPVEALQAVLVAMPAAKKRRPRFDSVNPPLSELPQREVTVAVKPIDMDESSERLDEIDRWLPKA